MLEKALKSNNMMWLTKITLNAGAPTPHPYSQCPWFKQRNQYVVAFCINSFGLSKGTNPASFFFAGMDWIGLRNWINEWRRCWRGIIQGKVTRNHFALYSGIFQSEFLCVWSSSWYVRFVGKGLGCQKENFIWYSCTCKPSSNVIHVFSTMNIRYARVSVMWTSNQVSPICYTRISWLTNFQNCSSSLA